MPSENNNNSIGKVSIVGAGPGDPELVTIKAKDRISKCDVLLYDYLLSEDILQWTNEECEKICVGKRRGMHSMKQESINALIVEKASLGRHVVRLKGGDPFVFGRGGEEIKTIKEQGLEFEVIPGVTSGVAAAASLGLPLTHREHASTLLFITGHEDPEKKRPRINWEEVVVGNSTIVIYMGMKHLRDIADELMYAGKPAKTPAAIVEWVSMPNERKHLSHLAALADDVDAMKLGAPSIVIIGDVLTQ